MGAKNLEEVSREMTIHEYPSSKVHSDVAVIIPSRLGSERLYQKPLQLIGPYTMIEHVVHQIKSTGLENIYVATDSLAIAEKVVSCGVEYILTNESCLSGTDRVYEASKLVQKPNINYIINVQGDMPFVEPEVILKVIESLKSSSYEIITPVVKVGIDIANSHSNVKVVTNEKGKALYFSRSLIPYGATEFLYHIGIYGFRKRALAKFIKLPQTHLEKNEKLEQLRALQHNIDIGVCYSNTVPISVDTSEDLSKAIEFYNNRNLAAKMSMH